MQEAFHSSFVQVAMNGGHNQDREREIREKIATQMRSIKGPAKEISAEELQKLKTAASRLNQMLKAAAEADQQALKSAAARLDQLLSDIRAGKDLANVLKRRSNGRS